MTADRHIVLYDSDRVIAEVENGDHYQTPPTTLIFDGTLAEFLAENPSYSTEKFDDYEIV